MVLDILDGTVVTADGTGLTPTTANQTLVTIPIPENHYKWLIVNIDLEIAMVTTPVVQQIDLELINDSTVIKTFNFSPGATDVLGIWDYNIRFPVQKNNSGNIILQLGNAGAADVDTTIKAKSVFVEGVA